MQAIVIAGMKKSGKTALLALLAEVLEQKGKRVAVIKHSSHPLEQGNTDAFWLRRPERPVVNVAPGETVLFWPEALSFTAIAAHLDVDVLLQEGGDAPSDIPRLLCLPEDAAEAEAFLEKHAADSILASVGGTRSLPGVPHFAETDPAAAEKIAGLLLNRTQ